MNKEVRSSQNSNQKNAHPFWKFFWLSFLVLSLAYAWYSFYSPSNAIQWKSDVTTMASLTNQNSNKNTFLFFTGKWCSPCRIMERQVFADREVESIVNATVTPVVIDIDDPMTKEIVEYYRVGATPTTLFVDPNGEVLDYAMGKLNKAKFLEMLEGAKAE